MKKTGLIISAIILILVLGVLFITFRKNRHTDLTGNTTIGSASNPNENPIPQQYQTLYNNISSAENDLSSSLAQYSGSGNGGAGLTYAAELSYANSNTGPNLLAPGAMNEVNEELDAFQEMGITGVTFAVDYPILMPNFPNSSEYLAFYEQVMQAIQAHGMQSMIETDPTFPPPFTQLQVSYQGMTLQTWDQDQLQMAQTILDNLKPNYLVLGTEPDTVAKITGVTQIEDPTTWADSIQYVTQNIQNQGNTKIIAGVDTWVENAVGYAEAMVKVPGLDGFSVHMYPEGVGFNENLIAIAKIANQAHLPISISEAWLYKRDPGDTQASGNDSAAVSAESNIYYLDAFSFMAPLDQEFLANMVTYAKDFNAVWISPFWTQYFFAYLNYGSTTAGNSFSQNFVLLRNLDAQNIPTGQLTTTGQAYARLVH